MLVALAVGLALRLLIVFLYPALEDDSLIYGTIARNLVLHGTYALGTPALHPTLIRLPGYPLFLAAIFRCFGLDHYGPVLAAQVAFDLASCLLVAGFARDRLGPRCARWALWIAILCPFTASYVAIPMTETLSIFCVSMALFSAARLAFALEHRRRAWAYILLLASALGGAVLLRPDGALLAVAALTAVLYAARRATRRDGRSALGAVVMCGLLATLPLVPWTIRNAVRFHQVQPLAPRFATDPGVFVPLGYVRWTRTWFAEFASNEEFYWDGNETTLHPGFLPARAFDSAPQRGQTLALIAAYNAACTPAPAQPATADDDPAPPLCRISPAQDRLFEQLAHDRYAAHPLTRRLGLPLVRLADMWLRPRVAYLPVPLRWWQLSLHPWSTLFAAAYAALNAALLLAAAYAFLRRRVPFAGMMLAYIALRCALLLTIENAEPRYTLECFPLLFVAAAAAMARAKPHSKECITG